MPRGSASRSAKTAPVLPEGYTWPELHRLVGTTLRAGISVLVRGHPGVGKSTLAARLATEMGLPLVDIRLAQRDPADLAGVWFPDPASGTLRPFPPEWALAAAARPTFIFLDEINAGVTRLHQAAAYQIVLDRRVGTVQFHPETVVMAAGNLEEDNAIVTPLSSALCNRFAHYTLRVDARSWLDWAAAAGIDEAILGYVARYGEEALYRADDDGMAFPSPRTWEMASRVYARAEQRDQKRLVSACVGIEAAEQLFSWLKLYGQVDAARIVRQGQKVDFTTRTHADPSFVYAASYSVAAWLRTAETVTDAELPNVVRFLRSPGLDAEYVFLFLRQVNRNKELFARLRQLPEFRTLAGELVELSASLYR
jgi:SpoVK/Ycf46/Vps4 family AAA+-type ATPase